MKGALGRLRLVICDGGGEAEPEPQDLLDLSGRAPEPEIALEVEAPAPPAGVPAASEAEELAPPGLASLRELHERARSASLSSDERQDYADALDRFLAMVVSSQNQKIRAGQTLRRSPRVGRTVEVELTWSTCACRVVTLDLGNGGFSAILPEAPPLGDRVQAQLRLRRRDVVSGSLRVTDVRRRRGSARVSFAFEELGDAERAMLDAYVADELLSDFSYR